MRIGLASLLASIALPLVPAVAGTDVTQGTTVVARWIQYAPGSSPSALAAGSYGDQPASLVPTVLARAVITGGACPSVSLDHGVTLTMKQRFDANTLTNVPGTSGSTNGKVGYPQYFVQNTAAQNFANGTPMATTSWTECEAVVPSGHQTASIDGVALKLPLAHPKRILVIADTGCRMNGVLSAAGGNQQNCASPTAFPWAYLANYEATFKPDLIVHIGDWFYRDTDCKNTFTGCNDPTSANYETWGDTFDSWNADVLFPAKRLLATAPWIMVRGNHESCGRGARGWYALLDPRPYDAAKVGCGPSGPAAPSNNVANYSADFEPTYVVPVDRINYLVHDSSFANDSAVAAATAQNYDIDLTNVLAAVGPSSNNVFVTHKPSFGLIAGSVGSGAAPVANGGDFTEQAVFAGGTYAASAFKNGVPSNIGLFLSGHVHQFQYVDLLDRTRFAPQLIVGMGGSLLDPDVNTAVVPAGNTDVPSFNQSIHSKAAFDVNHFDGSVAAATTEKSYSHDEFGFAILNSDYGPFVDPKLLGYEAGVFKISSTTAGHCIVQLQPTRRVVCAF